VDDFESYVQIQSEAAIRHIASLYSYDQSEEHEPTLRESADEVAEGLKGELEVRLAKAGVIVDEARLMHLAYAPEIAQAMLRRQQAEAVIAARQKIVHGAVSMVDMALRELSEKSVVQMDEETQSGNGQQPSRRALRRRRSDTRGQYRHALQLRGMAESERKPFLLRIPPDLWRELEKMGCRRTSERQRTNRISTAPGGDEAKARR
jgi:hypothetical protein